ncbi:unnamed protein product [Bathycoccus prasinos]
MINGVEEVLILLFTALSEVIYSGKDSIRFQKTNDKKKEDVKPKYLARKMFQQKYLGFVGFKV